MKRIALALMLLFITATAVAGDNPGKSAAPFRDVPADRPSRVTLENRRVQNISGDTITYSTGRKTITIKADSPAARQFVRDVRAGRRSATADVTLVPDRKSPFNAEYKAR
jgi:hypothetical protein